MSELTEYIADFLKVICDTTRLNIIELLKAGEKNSKEIETELKKSQSTISQHLKTLYDANLIKWEKKEVGIKDEKGVKTVKVKSYSIKDNYLLYLLSNIQSFVVNLNKDKIKSLSDLSRLHTLL